MLSHSEHPSKIDQQPAPASQDRDQDGYYDDGVLHIAGPIMAVAYAAALIILRWTFFESTEALFDVTVVSGVFMIFFVLPLTMMHVRSRVDRRWHSDEAHRSSQDVMTWTGTLKRYEAVIQVVIIPLAIMVGFISFSLIWVIEGA